MPTRMIPIRSLDANGLKKSLGILPSNSPTGSKGFTRSGSAGGGKLTWVPGAKALATNRPIRIATTVFENKTHTSLPATLPRTSAVSSEWTMLKKTRGVAKKPQTLQHKIGEWF